MEASCGGMMLVTRPDYDPGTKYLSAWSQILIDEARTKGIEVCDLAGKKATKNELEGRLKKKRPELVVLNGHGNDERVTGQDGEPLVEVNVNPEVLSGAVTYAVSCQSAARLGRLVGSYPNSAYIGYEKKFSIIHSHGYFKRPTEDPLAKPFMDFSNQIVRGLFKGHSVEESVKRAKEIGETHLRSLETSLSDPDAQMAAAFLLRDLTCLVAHGDQTKRVV